MSVPDIVLNLTVRYNPDTKSFYVTADEPRGLMLLGKSMSEVLRKVPMALAELREAGAKMPLLENVELL